VGFVDVEFTGTITLTPGFEASGASISVLYNADGDFLDGFGVALTGDLTWVLFTVRVLPSDVPV
jgi:hypothetical protein